MKENVGKCFVNDDETYFCKVMYLSVDGSMYGVNLHITDKSVSFSEDSFIPSVSHLNETYWIEPAICRANLMISQSPDRKVLAGDLGINRDGGE